MSFQSRGSAIAIPALLLSAAIAVAAGTGVYLLDRDWAGLQFLAPIASWQPGTAGIFGAVGGALPSLTHAYAFTILMILALWPAGHARRAGAVIWLLAALALECLQSVTVKAAVTGAADLLDRLPFSENWVTYVLNGRFDAIDLFATALGVFIAYIASSVLEQKS